MKRTVLGGAFVLASLALSVPLIAHHGAASFDSDREITLKGTVAEWMWSNPHCFLKFDAKDDTGMVRTWTVETGNPSDITRQGFQRSSFKFGDIVTVTLQPVKTGAPVGRLRSAVLADGSRLPIPATGAPSAPQPSAN
jgi:hypothetical protein